MTPNLLTIDSPQPQAALVNTLAGEFMQDERILACWLRGSFALGTADKYSDIDMALAIDDEQFYYAFENVKNIVPHAGDCIVSWDSPKDVNGAGITAFYADCSFLDIKAYRASRVGTVYHPGTVRVLFDRGHAVRFADAPEPDQGFGPPPDEQVWWKMVYFWICTYSAVRFLKREDYWYASGMISAIRGTLAQLLWLWTRPDEAADMSFVVWGAIRRDLDPEFVAELAGTVSESERSEMVGNLGKLIAVFEKHGRHIARDTGAEYPERLATTVAAYYRREFAR